MHSVIKARLALAGTLLLGVGLGAVGTAEFLRPRGGAEAAPAAGELPRFVRDMERYLAPHDDAQRAALRPLLLATDSVNRAAVRQAQSAMRDGLLQLRARAEGVLDAAQRQRLDQFIADRDAHRPLPPRMGPPMGSPPGPPPGPSPGTPMGPPPGASAATDGRP